MVTFDSLNPYETLEFLVGNSPEELIKALKEIRTPIKIIAIVPQGTRHVAYIMGDVRKKDPKQQRAKILKLKGVE